MPFKLLDQIIDVNVIDDNGNKYVFNIPGDFSYTTGTQYVLSIGTYTLYVAQQHPITILNSGMKNEITISGDNEQKKLVDGTEYMFYHGNVTINVIGDFGNVSVYCYYHGYMGGENILT